MGILKATQNKGVFLMLPFFQFKKRRVTLGIIVIFIAVIAAATIIGSPLGKNHQSGEMDAQAAKQDGKIKVTAETTMVQTIHYLKCGDDEVFRTKPADNLIGLNYNQIVKMYPDWSIEKFDTDAVEMSLQVDSYCREHANNTFIGIQDGYVASFYGIPGPKAILKEKTKIAVTSLTPQDLEEVKKGIVVTTREELMRTLEGLESH
jgi:hypothetical protein